MTLTATLEKSDNGVWGRIKTDDADIFLKDETESATLNRLREAFEDYITKGAGKDLDVYKHLSIDDIRIEVNNIP